MMDANHINYVTHFQQQSAVYRQSDLATFGYVKLTTGCLKTDCVWIVLVPVHIAKT